MNPDNVRLWSLQRVHVVCSGLRAKRVAQIGHGEHARFYLYRLFFREVPGKLDPSKSVKRWVLERTPILSPNDPRSSGDDVEVGVWAARTPAEDAIFVDASKLGRFAETVERQTRGAS